MKGAPSQQGGGSGGFGGGGFPQWLGMASQYFPQYFGGYHPQGGGGAPAPPGGGGGIDYGGGTPQYGPSLGTPDPAPPGPPQPPQATTGLLGGAPIAGAATGASPGITSGAATGNTMGPYGLLSGMPPQHSGWMPGYGGSRSGYGSGGQPGGIMPPQTQPGPQQYMPPQGGYGLFGPFAQY